MKRILILVAFAVLANDGLAQQKNLLSGKYAAEELREILIPAAQWTPFPKISAREEWAAADQHVMNAIVAKAEALLTYQWPYIPATKSLAYVRTGDRDEYQRISFRKREVLGTLLLAEIQENKGRFIDQIIDGVWSICEESFWGIPAHLPKDPEIAGLVDTSDPFVDLFAAETATVLAWVDYFLGDKLDAVSPQIRKRIHHETQYRILEPLMTKPHGWMGFNTRGRRPNNWNPWICSNWLNTVLLLEVDDHKRAEAVAKILRVLDNYLNPHPQDGGCDEGPAYWGAAAASLYDNISLLNLATDNAFDYVFHDEKIRNMARYIYRAQIGPEYFVNFADSPPRPGMDAHMIYRFGKDIGDAEMIRFGAYFRKPAAGGPRTTQFFRNFFAVFIEDELQQAPQGLPLPQDVWLPDLQVMIARDQAGSTEGLFVAAKGGNNAESHNHNDIGNYMVYYDGLPLVIDVGSGTYTRRTFSRERYDIWFNCSDYHNVPTINGETQLNGKQYRAADVDYRATDTYAQLVLDLSDAYPKEAGIRSWKRTIRLNRAKNVQITDEAALDVPGSVTHHLMTSHVAEVVRPGEILIQYNDATGKRRDFVVAYDKRTMRASVEKVRLVSAEDKGILASWGDNIYRINFTSTEPVRKSKFRFEIKPTG